MKRKCIIGTHETMFSQMIACIVRSFTAGIVIIETKSLKGLYAELDSDSELFVVLDPYTFSFALEKVCKKIYSANPRSVIICMCREKCNKFFGLRLYRCDVNCIISNVEGSKNLLAVMKNAFEGIKYYPKEIRDAIGMREHILMGECCSALTIRQIEILSHFASKEPPKYIASLLGLAESTLFSTIHRVIKKLGVTTREEAIEVAIANGIFGIK